MSLLARNVLFTVVVPGAGAVYLPWWILTRSGAGPRPVAWPGAIVIALGLALYLWCLSMFAIVGRGTPGPWDAPRRFVAAGPYRWVRNPMYISALTVVAGEAWLFASASLVLYAIAMAAVVHAFVVVYEEPTLSKRFGETYLSYKRSVRRWIPARPQPANRVA